MTLFTRREWMLLACIVLYSFVPNFGGLLRIAELSGGPAVIPHNPRALAAPLPIILHIAGSFLFCMLGAVQFLPSFRRRRLAWHRMVGKVVAIAGLLSAATGVWMTVVFTFPAELQGALLYWARLILGTAMFALIIWAVLAVRTGKVAMHRAAFLRAYAIGQGASTQAVLGIGWLVFAGTELLGPWRDIAMVAAWSINLLIAECLIRRSTVVNSPGSPDRHHSGHIATA